MQQKKNYLKITLYLLLSISTLLHTFAQNTEEKVIHFTNLKSQNEEIQGLEITFQNQITSFAVKAPLEFYKKKPFLFLKGEINILSNNCLNDTDQDTLFSNLIVLDSAKYKVVICPEGYTGNIKIYGISDNTGFNLKKFKETSEVLPSCDTIHMVSQEVWREGLTVPSYTREVHEVSNIIVHHSATSNGLTNYTSVVRNIYIYHTQSRGWSDIGYNYLIAQDGTVFMGRDPGNNEQDNVKGAHFCGSNTGTMGICMMGTYTDVSPEADAITSLENLLAWKTRKDDLDPLGMFPHALNPALSVIAGHRDGCATECPGQMTYNNLPTIRPVVNDLNIECENLNGSDSSKLIVYPTLVSKNENIHIICNDQIRKIELFDVSGKRCARYYYISDNTADITLPVVNTGLYILKVTTEVEMLHQKIIYRSN